MTRSLLNTHELILSAALDTELTRKERIQKEIKLVVQLERSIRRTHIREFVWLSVIVAEVIALVALQLMQH